jgi:hypothetical protein
MFEKVFAPNIIKTSIIEITNNNRMVRVTRSTSNSNCSTSCDVGTFEIDETNNVDDENEKEIPRQFRIILAPS